MLTSYILLLVIVEVAMLAHCLCLLTLAQPAMRKRKYCYHTALAVSDFLQMTFLIFTVVYEKNRDDMGPLTVTMEFFSLNGSYAVFLLALDTYIAVVHPSAFLSTQTNKMYMLRSLGVLPLVLLAYSFSHVDQLVYLSYVMPLLVIPYLCFATARRLRELSLNFARQYSRRHLENIKLLLMMVFIFYLEFVPSLVMRAVSRKENWFHLANSFVNLLGNVDTLFLYYVYKSEFRSTFLGMFGVSRALSGPASTAPSDAADVDLQNCSAFSAAEGQPSIPHEGHVRDAVQDGGPPVEVSQAA
ncbi:uncharacterized protein LOC125024999 isoform X2 [Penaeus chinensis]|uniref:uncharacterized protein LOC125024999 isoform X2 n=1 Tax=Penaeus chinensis TaxID=139456 RepID=UPI001FB58321|nr:uncharacterized protein LOC125024999 isoform X2 [Penaeus chinensis]